MIRLNNLNVLTFSPPDWGMLRRSRDGSLDFEKMIIVPSGRHSFSIPAHQLQLTFDSFRRKNLPGRA